jgi:hypothetical protein
MVPTCLLDDVIETVRGYIPAEARVPPLLLRGNSTSDLVSCSELQFERWEDPLVFAWCDMGFCDGMDDADYPGLGRFDFARKRQMAESADAAAYRLCATVSAAKAVPVIMVMSIAVALASSALLAGLALIAPSLTLLWQVSVYNHAGTGGDIK